MIHLVAHALHGRPLTDPTRANFLWRRLRQRFPDAFAACLMPDHLHLLAGARDAEAARCSLSHLLGAFTRTHPAQSGWTVAPPKRLPNVEHLRRNVRYAHLNPCRDGLVEDPLVYLWSTHRGVIGAEVDPWVSAERLSRALERPTADFAERFHAYVSGDPAVLPQSTPFPRAAPARAVPAVPLEAIRAAVLAATPWSSPTFRAELTALLARHQGWRDTSLIAKAAESSARTVQRHFRSVSLADAEARLRPAALCLGDRRLLRAHARKP